MVRRELARIADLHEKGFAPSSYELQDSGYNRHWLLPGYDPEAVGRFLAELAREAPPDLRVLPELPDDGGGEGALRLRQLTAEAEWRRVADLQGARLVAAGDLVVGSAGEILLTRGRAATHDTLTLATGQELRIDKDNVGDGGYALRGWQVTDSRTGEPVLWTRGRHYGGGARGYMLLPGQRCLVFPVTGTRVRDAVMTAVTESGRTALWFRWIARPRSPWRSENTKYEIVVSPDCDLTTELMCIICLAASWLGSYFESAH